MAKQQFKKTDTKMSFIMDKFEEFKKEERGKEMLNQLYLLDNEDDFAHTLLPIFLQYLKTGTISKHLDKNAIDAYIEFKNLNFSYDKNVPILKNIN